MGRGTLEGSSSLPSSNRRRRRNHDDDDHPKVTPLRSCQPNKHLYLALDDWSGGYCIHKLDAGGILDQDPELEHKLPEPPAVRMASPEAGPMAFAALGTCNFAATNPGREGDRAPATLVYDTETAALAVGPRVPGCIHGLGDAMAVGKTLYALTSVPYPMPSTLHALSWDRALIPDRQAWDPTMEWCWNTVPSPSSSPLSLPPPPINGLDVISYAVHPDGRTIFVSAGMTTYALDTSNGEWKALGAWLLPFRGQAFFDSSLDAWVGLHVKYDGWVCCCPFTSLSTSTTQQPECRMLMEKLVQRNIEDPKPKHWLCPRGKDTSLTYMGDSRFAFVENVLRSGKFRDGSVIHVTLFGLKYNHKGELKTTARHATRSYAVSKNNRFFSHAAFWM